MFEGEDNQTRYGHRTSKFPADQFVRFVCGCGARNFRLQRGPEGGAPERVCTRCWTTAALCDGKRWRDPDACKCGVGVFEIAVGLGVIDGELCPVNLGVRCSRCVVIGAPWQVVWSRPF